MSEAFLTPPKIGEDGRKLFEKKYSKGDLVVTSQLRVDNTLRKIRNLSTDDDLDNFEMIAESHLGEALKKSSYETAESIIDYFHLKIKHALIKQIIFAYSAFSQREKFDMRRKLVDGIYGTISEILNEALAAYDSAPAEEIPHLTGIINELTTLALLNRRQVPERLAILSDITSDLYNASDLMYFTFTKGKEKSSSYHIQVKTRDVAESEVKVPADGILITENHTLNSKYAGFPTSRAIVSEVNAIDTPEQEKHLANAVQTLDSHMQSRMTKADKIYEIMENSEVIADALKVIQGIVKRTMDENPEATDFTFEFPEI